MTLAQSPARASLPSILVLGTGGTIAGVATGDPRSAPYRAGVLGVEQLLQAVPGAAQLATLQAEQVCNIDSKDAQPALWLELARRAASWLARPEAAACVITHGTDTLEESAYALDCLLASPKPVVLTAAMLPATALSADGPRNLFDALQVAADARAAGRGVLGVLHGRVHGARDVSKSAPHQLDAFASGERGPLGFVSARGVEFTREIPRGGPNAGWAGALLEQAFAWPRVEFVTSHAGADGAALRALLLASRRGELQPPLAGLVVQGSGSGAVHGELQGALDEASQAGVRVVYAARAGCMQGGDYDGLNPLKARVRLMLELALVTAS